MIATWVSWSTLTKDGILTQLRPHIHIGHVRVFFLYSEWHLPHVGLLTSPNLKRHSFRSQYPVTSPVTCLNWCLLSLVACQSFFRGLWKETPHMFLSRYGMPVFFVLSAHTVPDSPLCNSHSEMPQAGSGPMNGCREHAVIKLWEIWLDEQLIASQKEFSSIG